MYAFGLDFMLLGDYNAEPNEAPVANLIAANAVAIPDTNEEIAVPTRVFGDRHIDYALVTEKVRIAERNRLLLRRHVHGFCGHPPDALVSDGLH